MKTFIVRIAPAPEEGSFAPLHGVVDSVTSGRRAPFRDAAELVALLHEAEGADIEWQEIP